MEPEIAPAPAAPATPFLATLVLRVLRDALASSLARNGKSLPVLRRAYTSLKACPISFSSLLELQQLDGFESHALLRDIAQRLQALHDDNGWVMPQHYSLQADLASTSSAVQDTQAAGPRGAKTKTARKRKAPDNAANAEVDLREEVAETPKPLGRSKCKTAVPQSRSAIPRLYVPQPRTGTHGILVALYSLTETCPSQDSCLIDSGPVPRHAKATIIQHAQPFSDAKYIPKSASSGFGFGAGHMGFNSAWSGMKTLINRGYVYRTGNPARFSLSYTGWQVAKMCAERENGIMAGCRLNSSPSAQDNAGVNEVDGKDANREDGECSHDARKGNSASTRKNKSPGRDGPFLYTYLKGTDALETTTSRAEAAVRLSDDDYCMQYRIVFYASCRSHPIVSTGVCDIRPFPSSEIDLLSGQMRAAICNEIAPGIPEMTKEGAKSSLLASLDASVLGSKTVVDADGDKRPAQIGKRREQEKTSKERLSVRGRPRRAKERDTSIGTEESENSTPKSSTKCTQKPLTAIDRPPQYSRECHESRETSKTKSDVQSPFRKSAIEISSSDVEIVSDAGTLEPCPGAVSPTVSRVRRRFQ